MTSLAGVAGYQGLQDRPFPMEAEYRKLIPMRNRQSNLVSGHRPHPAGRPREGRFSLFASKEAIPTTRSVVGRPARQ